MIRLNAFGFQAFFYFIKNSTELPLAFTRANNKIVREPAYSADIQQHDVGSLFIAGRVYGPPGYFYTFQFSNLQNIILIGLYHSIPSDIKT